MSSILRRSILIFALVIALADLGVALSTLPAFADTATTISIPWGDWISPLLSVLAPIILGLLSLAAAWIAAKIGGPAADFYKAANVDQLLKNAVDYGIGAVVGAAHGKTVDVQTSNAVLAQAAAYAVANGPAIAEKLGDTLMPKLYARLAAAGIIAPESAAIDHGVTVPAAS